MSDFWEILLFFKGCHSYHQKEKNIKKKKKKNMSRPTDPTWKVRLPVKQGFFFFVALSLFAGHEPDKSQRLYGPGAWTAALLWHQVMTKNWHNAYHFDTDVHYEC